jgi:hypothetical protein
MSYSFNVRAPSKASALAGVETKLDEVVAAQPIHAHDRETAGSVAGELLTLIGEPDDGEEMSVNVSGSCWQRDGVFKGVSLSVDISHQRPIVAG